MLNPVDSPDIGIDAGIAKVDGGAAAQVRMAITLPDAGSYTLDSVIFEVDARGRVLGKISSTLRFAVAPGRTTMRADKLVPLREGASRLRVILRDTESGRMGSLTIPL